jgi:hypothetical protein
VSTDATIVFKEWLPDQPELNNPGLIEALNVVPAGNAGYVPFRALDPFTAGGTLTGVQSGIVARRADVGIYDIYAATDDLYLLTAGTRFTLKSASTTGSHTWTWAQFDDLVIATTTFTLGAKCHTVGASSAFTALSLSDQAPNARCVGVVGQFVVLGDLVYPGATAGPNTIQWSAIGEPRDWPTPGSTTAIASQAGEQILPVRGGNVRAIHGGDQFGVILQQAGVTRMTYIGGNTVFQFDEIDNEQGSIFLFGSVRVGDLTYFISRQGFCRTNGVAVERIGYGKVDRYFFDTLDTSSSQFQVTAAYDPELGVVCWSYPTTNGQNDQILFYEVTTGRWSRASQEMAVFIAPVGSYYPVSGLGLFAFNATGIPDVLSRFDGTIGSAVFTTAETEGNPGGFTRVIGVKPLVDVTANAVTVAVGTRNNRTDAVSFTAETTANSRTGFCDFRSEARYHRARVTVAGTFNAAQGIEIDAVWSGQT